jgi:hypothetical protein
MVRDGDADLQTLLDAMITLTRLYDKTNENEKKTVLGIFDVEVPYAKGRRTACWSPWPRCIT